MTTSIYLRPLRLEDALISYRWRNDPKVWTYTGKRPNIKITPEIEKNWLENTLKQPDQLRYAICIKQSDQYIGNVQLLDINNHKAELHIFIGDPTFWGKSIGSQATLEVLKLGFFKHMLTEIYLKVHPDNLVAQKIYKKAGFEISNQTAELLTMNLNKARFIELNSKESIES